MKSLLVFLACATAFGAALWWSDPAPRARAALPAPADDTEEQPPVLVGSDLADGDGLTPFRGVIRRASGLELRLYEKDYVRAFVRLGRLARRDGAPLLEDVSGAVFDPPRDGRPRLRLTLEAPEVVGDLKRFVRDPGGAPRVAELRGGVVVRDASGHALLKVDSLVFDAEHKTLASDERVELRFPDRGAVVRGEGLVADLELRRLELKRAVSAGIATGERAVRVECDGGAVIQELDEGRRLRVTLRGGARFAGAFGTARCEEVVVALDRRDGGYVFGSARLAGDVQVDVDPGVGRGIESLHAPVVVFESETRIRCTGPLRAVRRGTLTAFGPGERVVDVHAGGGVDVRLRRTEKSGLDLEELRFPDGFVAADRAGTGRLQARTVTYVVATGTLEARHVTEARTADGSCTADFVRVTARGREDVRVRVEGAKRFLLPADGRLGALGETERGTLDLTAKGPLVATLAGKKAALTITGRVVARVGERAGIDADTLALEVENGRVVSFEASGSAHLFAKGRGLDARGARIAFRGGTVIIAGTPATVVLPEGRTVRAPAMRYFEDGRFLAEGGVTLVAPLRGEQPWTVECGAVDVRLDDERTPARLLATGGVDARGPAGERIAGDTLLFVEETGVATLTGKPARVRRGNDLVLTAPRLEVRLRDGQLDSAATGGGPAAIEVRPQGAGPEGFSRWTIELDGTATWRGATLAVPKGARLAGFDAKGELALRARAGAVTVDLERTKEGWRPLAVRGREGVRVESLGKKPARVDARALDYVLATRLVAVRGEARVVAAGWPERVRFEKVVFRLTDKGIDLLRASQVEVAGPRRPAGGK